MTWWTEQVEIVQRYIKEVKGKDVSLDRIFAYPHHRVVGWLKDAKAYYGMDNHCYDLSNADPEKRIAYLRKGRATEQYYWVDGKWVMQNCVLDEVYKD